MARVSNHEGVIRQPPFRASRQTRSLVVRDGPKGPPHHEGACGCKCSIYSRTQPNSHHRGKIIDHARRGGIDAPALSRDRPTLLA